MTDYRYSETGLRTRTEQVIIRATLEEKRVFFVEAQRLGISISAFIRLLLHNWMTGETTISRTNKGE